MIQLTPARRSHPVFDEPAGAVGHVGPVALSVNGSGDGGSGAGVVLEAYKRFLIYFVRLHLPMESDSSGSSYRGRQSNPTTTYHPSQ